MQSCHQRKKKSKSYLSQHTGYIAQELELIAPELVRTGDDGFKQVNYTGIIPLITGAIKALFDEMTSLDEAFRNSTKKLEAENAELRARLDRQEKELTEIKKRMGLQN